MRKKLLIRKVIRMYLVFIVFVCLAACGNTKNENRKFEYKVSIPTNFLPAPYDYQLVVTEITRKDKILKSHDLQTYPLSLSNGNLVCDLKLIPGEYGYYLSKATPAITSSPLYQSPLTNSRFINEFEPDIIYVGYKKKLINFLKISEQGYTSDFDNFNTLSLPQTGLILHYDKNLSFSSADLIYLTNAQTIIYQRFGKYFETHTPVIVYLFGPNPVGIFRNYPESHYSFFNIAVNSYDENYFYRGYHELAHVIFYNMLGNWAYSRLYGMIFLNEGFADANSFYDVQNEYSFTKAYIDRISAQDVLEIIGHFRDFSDFYTYPLASCFVDTLLKTYGDAKFVSFLSSLPTDEASFVKNFLKVYGVSFESFFTVVKNRIKMDKAPVITSQQKKMIDEAFEEFKQNYTSGTLNNLKFQIRYGENVANFMKTLDVSTLHLNTLYVNHVPLFMSTLAQQKNETLFVYIIPDRTGKKIKRISFYLERDL